MAEKRPPPFQKDFCLCFNCPDDSPYVTRIRDIFRHYDVDVLRSAPTPAVLKNSRARYYVFIDTQQSLDSEFFRAAVAKVQLGIDIVRANRRHEDSRFRTPVRWLPYVWSRHHLSLGASSLLRRFFPFKGQDLSSKNIFIKRTTLEKFFVRAKGSPVIFPYELSLLSATENWSLVELPCRLHFDREKRIGAVARESGQLLWALRALWHGARRGHYESYELKHWFTSDDWGISRGVNEGILRLAQQGIITRVSMMATEPHLTHRLDQLRALPNVQIGLHLNLSYGTRQSFGHRSPLQFLRRWIFTSPAHRTVLLTQAGRELIRQIKIIKDLKLPLRYLDGHHHLHLAPGFLEKHGGLLREAGIQTVRYPYHFRHYFSPAKFLLNILSLRARGAFRKWDFNSFPVYYPDLKTLRNLHALKAGLRQHPHHEVIVHPALFDDVENDTYRAERLIEFKTLSEL